MQPIIISENSNIQDGVVIHSKAGAQVTIGKNSSIAHRSIIHGPCVIGNHVFVGFNSVLFNCKVGDHSAVRHNAVVDGRDLPKSFYVPAMSYINARTDLSQYPPIDISISEFSESVVSTNIELVQIDDQVHFRDPGSPQKGSFASESLAAAIGGITSFMDMPNTNPATLDLTALHDKKAIAAQHSIANYAFHFGVSAQNLDIVEALDPKLVSGVKVFMGASTGNMLVDDPKILERMYPLFY